jgi:hypothetical protein
MAELKTKENDASVEKFLNAVKDEEKRKDSFTLLELLKKTTKQEPKMWGSSIIGFGNYRYKSPKTGREGDWFLTGFSPRKQNMTVYFSSGFQSLAQLMKDLGKYKTGGGCLYFNKLSDIDIKVLTKMLKETITNPFLAK